MSFNKVLLLGNLTRDPELRYTPKGTAVAKIGLAVNRQWKSESGEKMEEVTFIDVDAFGRQAEVIAQYMKKGREMLIEGRLKLDTWEDKNTKQKKSKLGVVLESFSFTSGGKAQGESRQPEQKPNAGFSTNGTMDAPPIDEPPVADDGNVPF